MEAFDYDQWQHWLNKKKDVLTAGGLRSEVRSRAEFTPCSTLEIEGARALAAFHVWQTNLADFEILRISDSTTVASDAGIQVTDANFEAVFQTFLAEFDRANSCA